MDYETFYQLFAKTDIQRILAQPIRATVNHGRLLCYA